MFPKEINESKLASFRTKNSRREKKYRNILTRDFDYQEDDIKFCKSSSVIAVCNAGLSTGVSRERLLHLFLPFGIVKNVILIPGKSSSFVEFFSENIAEDAYIKLHCTSIPDIKSGELFLCFVPRAPVMAHNLVEEGTHLPVGLQLRLDFVTKEEELALLACVDWSSADVKTGQALKHRKVRHYGYQFDYNTNNVDPDDPLLEPFPPACETLFDKLKGVVDWRPDQITVNQYQPGQGIPSHVDTHSAFEDQILSLSLGADVVMEFRRGNQVIPVLLPSRSLLIMGGETRYCWSHGITPRKSDIVPCRGGGVTLQPRETRTSFTLRKLHSGPCNCSFPQHCDSQQSDLDLERAAAKLEALHVQQVYEQIAPHFSDTRQKSWPNVQQFVQSQPPGCVLFDVGCGNGKYLSLNPLACQIGCDSSFQLLKICRRRQQEVLACNCLHLPVCDESVDCCISIAVIHHLATQDRRLRAVQEIGRVLRPGGSALIYVWARDQERGKVKSSYLRQGVGQAISPETPQSIFALPVHTNRTAFSHADMLVPWKLKPSQGEATQPETNNVFLRYYHVFDEGELESLCRRVPQLTVIRSYYDQGNWCVVLEKLKQ